MARFRSARHRPLSLAIAGVLAATMLASCGQAATGSNALTATGGAVVKGDAPAPGLSGGPTATATPTPTPTLTPTLTPATVTATQIPTPTLSPSVTLGPSASASMSPTPTSSMAAKQVPSGSPTLAPPTIGKISPSEVAASGGESVFMTGRGFDPRSTVTVGGVPATIKQMSLTGVSFIVPAGPAGRTTIEVVTPAGRASSNMFWRYGPPSITKVQQPYGFTRGGEKVNLTGPWIHLVTAVRFGGRLGSIVRQFGLRDPATGVGMVEVKTPPATSPGMVAIEVTSPMGTTRLDNAFDYYGLPTITSITPSSGPAIGGNDVVIEGRWLDYARNDRPPVIGRAVEIIGRSKDRLVVRIPQDPARKPGPVRVSVALDYSYAEIPNGYTFLGPTVISGTLTPTPVPPARPMITSITPNSGISEGGDTVTITGTGMGTASQVTFGPNAAQITGRTATSVTVISPASGLVGPVTVTVVTGQGNVSKPSGFTYWSPIR